jgi:chromosome segregation ATPase
MTGQPDKVEPMDAQEIANAAVQLEEVYYEAPISGKALNWFARYARRLLATIDREVEARKKAEGRLMVRAEELSALRSEVQRLTEERDAWKNTTVAVRPKADCYDYLLGRYGLTNDVAGYIDSLKAEIATKDEQVVSLKAEIQAAKQVADTYKAPGAAVHDQVFWLGEQMDALKSKLRSLGETFSRMATAQRNAAQAYDPREFQHKDFMAEAEANAALARECEEMGK